MSASSGTAGFATAPMQPRARAASARTSGEQSLRRPVSKGTASASLVHPREVYKAAILSSAATIIVCHNHPSGNPSPSVEDRDLTRRLYEAGNLLGIPLLDSVIVGHGRYHSMKDEGEL